VSDGANIVLMGDEDLDEVLNARRLVRLKQRLKLRQKVSPLSASELTAYFKHCFRLAGNEFDTIFEPGTSDLLHSLSGGVPRMANNIVESALAGAAENKQEQVGVALIKLVATEEFGLDTGVQVSEHEAAVEAAPVVLEAVVEAPQINIAAPEVAEVAPVEDVAPVEHEKVVEDEISELIQDTLPDLAILAPALANPSAVAETPDIDRPAEAVEAIIETATVEEDADEPIPTLSDSIDGEIPPWERDPTLAQLRPDLDALEHAMAVAQGLDPDDDDETEPDGGEAEIPELVPEITLDREIQAKIEEAAELLKQAEKDEAEALAAESDDKPAETAKPVVEATVTPRPPVAPQAPMPPATPAPPAAPNRVVEAAPKAPAVVAAAPTSPIEKPADDVARDEEPETDPELEKIAVNLARAKTIDDCDDKMAETLFGEEFSMMAAQVAANAPAESSANDELELAVADFDGTAAVNVEIKPGPALPASNLDGSASQRMRTVQALNAGPSATPPANGANAPPSAAAVAPVEPTPASSQPESIEDQINTSMTQTLEALSVRPDSFNDDDGDDDKGGFFSRFRRS